MSQFIGRPTIHQRHASLWHPQHTECTQNLRYIVERDRDPTRLHDPNRPNERAYRKEHTASALTASLAEPGWMRSSTKVGRAFILLEDTKKMLINMDESSLQCVSLRVASLLGKASLGTNMHYPRGVTARDLV